MLSISHKKDSYRKAVAESRIAAGDATLERLRSNDVPKKDILSVARCAGTMAAKRTWEIIPYCHPLPLDGVVIDYEFAKGELVIRSSVEAVWKTGVEMEALTAVSVAALTVYDMLKPIDQNLEIKSTKLISKKGGKRSFREKVPSGFKSCVIVTSDGTYEGTRQDKSGQAIRDRLRAYGMESEYLVLPDEKEKIVEAMERFCGEDVSLILTTGGTGLGRRDVTVEATREVIEREVPGIMEAARSFGQKKTSYAMLSRGLAGQKGSTLIVNLPGSSRGVEESLDAIFPSILHAYPMMQGGGH